VPKFVLLALVFVTGPVAAQIDDIEYGLMHATERFPSLDDRELGGGFPESDIEHATWDRALPFLAQRVVDLGFDLPQPYGISMIGTSMQQDMLLSNLSLSPDDGPQVPIDFVEFGVARSDTQSVLIRADMWLFPFLNVFGMVGKVIGDATVPLAFPADEALSFLGLGALCPSGPFPPRPSFCDETVNVTATPDIDGYTVGVGTVLAMGWDRYFVVLPISYVESDMDSISSRTDTLTITPRIGFTLNPYRSARVAVYVGATYLDSSFDIDSTFTFPFSELDPSLQDFDLNYKIRQENEERWNYLVGLNFEFNDRLSVQGEVGFGGSRDNVIISVGYRY
jgi:hypothetical protein